MGNPSAANESVTRTVGGHEVTISNPGKVLFPIPKYTKLDLANYYVAVAEGALRGAGGRPNMLVRFPNGIGAPSFYQKRAPESRPPWIEVVTLRFPSGRTADEVVPRDAASLVWLANLACLELHPHPVRTDDLDHPDELRVDLDPVPGIKWPQVRQVAQIAREALDAVGLVGWPKTSGSRGMHLFVRIQRKWGFDDVRRAALALARDAKSSGAARGSRRASGGKKSGRACSSTTIRMPRIARSPRRTQSGPSRMRASRLRSIGMKWGPRTPLISHSAPCPNDSRKSGIATRRSTSMLDRWSSCWSSRRARRKKEWVTPPGRRTTASSRASRRGCSHPRLGASRSFR